MIEAPGILCISTYEKGQAFLKEAARLGCEVTLLTVDGLVNADWPRASLKELITMPEGLTPEQVLNTVCYLARSHRFDRIVALDEFDLEVAALLREHMRLPGMGETATRFFRDKLAMRVQARASGVAVPEFTGVFNYDEVRAYMAAVPGPWLLKPRTNASAIGIKPINHPDELWPILDQLGDLQSHYVLERFVAGEVYHVEGVSWKGDVLFAAPHKYGHPPMQTMHKGGVFTTRSLPPESDDAKGLVAIHAATLKALGMYSGVTHTEFIKSKADGKFYFLETAARVGGAYIAELVESSKGVNPWVEWARIEVATLLKMEYCLPNSVREEYAGSVICLAKQEEPDLSGYSDPEVVLRLKKHHHAGLIVRSASAERVESLVDSYGARFLDEFCASEPVPDKPSA
ncbi:glutathione synthase/RimK-type ligase-like ATP-grasp enzyme [Granulicella aggregans]|uniref:Glutathione synthase/RimK-type ligase-like ATP-grasp enzyme n=1 Tax=Granulicella aggregans TaxID=474949 RepID=A0A7W7Z8V7_9BACT|nr:ATPase [Granulicella aggregans]MBB5055333.1 glutathione synthase/RimK-type ligase-like ATP-grasp enzyme [Granulicella aggregans]